MIFRKLAIAAMMASASAAFAANQASSNQDSSTVKQAQQALNDKGFNVGAADGIVGPKTWKKIAAATATNAMTTFRKSPSTAGTRLSWRRSWITRASR